MIVVGTKFYGHDSAACVIDTERRTIAAASTERFTRIKHDGTFCHHALRRLLDEPAEVVASAFARFEDCSFQEETSIQGLAMRRKEEVRRMLMSPRNLRELERIDEAAFHRLLSARTDLLRRYESESDLVALGPQGGVANMEAVTLELRRRMAAMGSSGALVEFHDHHLCHAISAVVPSPFFGKRSLIVTLDGQGDGFFGKAFVVDGSSWRCVSRSPAVRLENMPFPASLGWIFSLFTLALGFRPGSDEGKVEALAAFGRPIAALLQEMTKATLVTDEAIGFDPVRIRPFLDPATLTQKIRAHAGEDVAATVQRYLEDTVVSHLNQLAGKTGCKRVALAGGVAANIILNLAVSERTAFNEFHICPFMGDEGAAVGAAILSALTRGADLSWLADEHMPYWGTCYSRNEVLDVLRASSGIRFEDMGPEWTSDAAKAISRHEIVAVFHGRMEFGPRALGHRSILANPADPLLRERMNVSIKQRPPWQPFCPMVLETERERLFERSFPHKHMATAFRVRPQYISAIPSAVHVDGTARPQFLCPQDDLALFDLLTEVQLATGYGVVINTSFNLHGRAIVEHPTHAVEDFIACNLDALYIEGYKVTRLAS